MAPRGDELDALDDGQAPGPAPALEGLEDAEASTPAPAAAPAAAAAAAVEVLDPPTRAGRNGRGKKRPPGSYWRRRRARGEDAGPSLEDTPAPPRASKAREPEPEDPTPEPAAKVDPEALKQAQETIDDPETLDFIEGLYRLPYEMWAGAVKVPEVVPTPPKIQRAAKLIKKCMLLAGPRAWMRYLPLVFLVIALGEDIGHGIKVVNAAKKGGAGPPRRPGEPIPSAPAAGPAPQPVTAQFTMHAAPAPPTAAAPPVFDGARDVPAAAAAATRIRRKARRGPRRGPRR